MCRAVKLLPQAVVVYVIGLDFAGHKFTHFLRYLIVIYLSVECR